MKYCSSCGKEVDPKDKFCLGCGQKVEEDYQQSESEQGKTELAAGMEISGNSLPPFKVETSKKFPRKYGVLVLITVLVIALGGVAYSIYLKGNPKKIYLQSELNTYTSALEEWKEKFGDDLDLQKAMAEEPSKSTMVLSGEYAVMGNFTEPEWGQINMYQKLLKDSTVKITSSTDPINKVSENLISLVYRGSNLMDVELFQAKDQIGARVPVLHDRYFYINPNDWGTFARKVSPEYVGPETLDLNQMDYKSLMEKQEELKKYGRKYGTLLIDNLAEENFTLEKGVAYNSPAGEKKLNQITLSLSDEEIHSLVNKMLDELINDSEFQDVLAKDFVELNGGVSLSGEPIDQSLLDIKSVKTNLKSNLEEFKKNFADIKFTDEFKMVVFIDDEGKIVDRNMNFTTDMSEESIDYELSSKTWVDSDTTKNSSWAILVKPTNEENSELKLDLYKKSKAGNAVQEEFDGSFQLLDEGKKVSDAKMKLTTSYYAKEGNSKKTQTRFILTGSDEGGEIPGISVNVIRVVDQDLENKYSKQDYEISIGVQHNEDLMLTPSNEIYGLGLSLNMNNTIDFIDKVETPSMSEQNSYDLAKLTPVELDMRMQEMQYRFASFYMRNALILGGSQF